MIQGILDVTQMKWIMDGLENDYFLYNPGQWASLRLATIVGSSISLLASILVCICFAYIFYVDRARASRVSLRCVLLSSVSSAITCVFVIINININANSDFCRASSIFVAYGEITSIAFLTIVGINLVLVFVVKVKRPRILEKCYYPAALIYSLVAVSAPIYAVTHIDVSGGNVFTCWYFIRYGPLNGLKNVYWIWYYSFAFVLVVIAVACSIIAVCAVVRENRILKKRARTESTSGNSNIPLFRKVLIRCIAYPLLPLIVNIWGFVKQMMILQRPKTPRPSFILAMFDAVFVNFEGFLIALVFFCDPAITTFASDRLHQWKTTYVDDFTKIAILSPQDGSGLEQVVVIDPEGDQPSIRAPRRQSVQMSQISVRQHQLKVIPVRRVSVAEAIFSRIVIEQDHVNGLPGGLHFSSNASANQYPSLDEDPNTDRKILIPYKYPRLAMAINWLLSRRIFRRRDSLDNASL